VAPIRVKSQIEYWPLVLSTFFPFMFVGQIYLDSGEWKVPLMIAAVFLLVPILGGWSQAIERLRRCEIDPANRKVTVHTVTMWFAPKVQSYSLDQFGAVRSYLVGHKRVDCRVELVTKPGGEGLLLAKFPPSSTSTSFWSIPKESEPATAQTLRQTVAEHCGLKDLGFVSRRGIGAQLGK
jgi:hypothetical protein